MRSIKTISALVLLIFISVAFKTDSNIIHPGVGETAPEIELKNPEGEVVKLSSLRGKVVLIDFWASWCRTCRIENNSVRQAYDIYKNKNFDIGEGFTVYSVSLDKDVEIWKKAIKNDRLSWPSHGCDFLKWDSPVVEKYNFSYLPHNLLIDKNGKIIAKGLIGDKLAETLKAHLAE
jgi:peroxiredoxin